MFCPLLISDGLKRFLRAVGSPAAVDICPVSGCRLARFSGWQAQEGLRVSGPHWVGIVDPHRCFQI